MTQSSRKLGLLALLAGACVALGCTTGEGDGQVESAKLFVEDCWNGEFKLDPTFFAANPHREETMMIRIQRGDDIEELSDGLIVLVRDIQKIRNGMLGQPIEVGLPPAVTPPGVPVVANPNPPLVTLSLYLHDTCHLMNGTLNSLSGTITFKALFSGDPAEDNADDRLTDAVFDAQFGDPRKIQPQASGADGGAGADGGVDGGSTGSAGTVNPATASNVTGWFRFFFQRGQPAQPFP